MSSTGRLRNIDPAETRQQVDLKGNPYIAAYSAIRRSQDWHRPILASVAAPRVAIQDPRRYQDH